MEDFPTSENAPTELGPPTAPASFSISARGFEGEDVARTLGTAVGTYVREFSRHFELGCLDGVTVAYDYAQALLDLDRGYKTSHRLTPSDGHAIGIAMTPSVLRDGTLKTHIILNANYVAALGDPTNEHFRHALHLLGHECAHVEVTAKFDAAFPGVLLRQQYPDVRVAFRWQVILACWDEYAATKLSAGFGEDPTDGYEDTFLKHLADSRQTANDCIKQYRLHGNLDQVLAEVYGTYGNLLKFAAYHLGNLNGSGVAVSDRARTVEALAGHWFAPYFARLDEACRAIAKSYGRWPDQSTFEAIGDIADELVAFGGVLFRYPEPGKLRIEIPYTADTIPSY